jgi:hypothetical protein
MKVTLSVGSYPLLHLIPLQSAAEQNQPNGGGGFAIKSAEIIHKVVSKYYIFANFSHKYFPPEAPSAPLSA